MLFPRVLRCRVVCAAAALSALTACAGGEPIVTPAVQPATATARRGSMVDVALTMHWPARRTRVRARRGPRWISPSTASVIVVVNESSTNVTMANAPKHGSVSTIEIAAPAGRDTFDVTLYDAPQRPGEKVPQGNALGKAVVAQTIVAAKQNTVKATIAGIPSRVVAAPVANQPFVRDRAGGAYAIVGDAAQQFVVTAQDADGNAIVPQPAVQMSPTSATAPYFSVTRNAKNQQQFAVAAIAANPPANGIATQFAISANDGNGNAVSDFVTIAQSSAIYVVYGKSSSGGPAVGVYDGSGRLVKLSKSAFAGLRDPRQIAYDHADRRLYVADAAKNGGEIVAYDSTGNPVKNVAIQLAGANAVAYDPTDGFVYAGNPANAVAAYTSAGTPVAGSGTIQNDATGAIAYYPVGLQSEPPQIVVANARLTGPSDPLLWFYSEQFTEPWSTAAPQLAGVTDMTGIETISGPFLIFCGTPAGSSDADLLMQPRVAYSFNTSTANVPGCQGVAFDPLSQLLFVANGAGNQVVAMQLGDFNEALGAIDSSATIVAPPSSGLSDPLRVAITY